MVKFDERVYIKINEEMKAKAEARAEARGQNLSTYVRSLIYNDLKKNV